MTTQTAVSTWSIDAVHSTAEFAVRHLMVSNIKGRFGNIEGTIEGDDSTPLAASVRATIDVASIDTGQEQRDADLRSDRFFNAEAYPTITFASKRVERVDGERFRVVGDLTMHGVTKEVALDTVYEGQVRDPWGNQRAGFTATAQLNRLDFGISTADVLETGGLLVSDKVNITLNIEAVRAG